MLATPYGDENWIFRVAHMSQRFYLHPTNPQARLIAQAAQRIRDGALVAYPTDSTYALGCAIHARAAQDRLRQIRQLDVHHDLSLLFPSISQLSEYAKVDNQAFRILKHATPGPFTFILEASKDVPRKLADPKRKTIGMRIPAHPVCHALLVALGEPLMSSTLTLPGDDYPLTDPEDIASALDRQIDLLLDGGACGLESSTVVDLTDWPPRVLREGVGELAALGLQDVG